MLWWKDRKAGGGTERVEGEAAGSSRLFPGENDRHRDWEWKLGKPGCEMAQDQAWE